MIAYNYKDQHSVNEVHIENSVEEKMPNTYFLSFVEFLAALVTR